MTVQQTRHQTQENKRPNLVLAVASLSMCLQAGCWRPCQPDADDPFQGTWIERSSISCDDGSESPGHIKRVTFCRGRFSVTCDPFEFYYDYEGDYELDPFAGSNTTGQAAEQEGRRWLAFEREESYLEASTFRFDKSTWTPTDLRRRNGDFAANAKVEPTLFDLAAE
jgi:hypothetical protein